MHFGAISCDIERKILRPRKIFEIFGRESHEISRAAACRRPTPCLGTSFARCEAGRRQAERILVRSHAILNAKLFCGREKFSKVSVENRTESHAPRRADARHCCWGPLSVVSKLSTAEWHGFRCDLTRFRTQNFAAAKNFRNFRPRFAHNFTRRVVPTLHTVARDL